MGIANSYFIKTTKHLMYDSVSRTPIVFTSSKQLASMNAKYN